jgi:hypothetical protein
MQSESHLNLYELFLNHPSASRPIHKWHHYFEVYSKYMSSYCGKSPVILEIGVNKGGSLELWRKWLGPHARIYGIDVEPAAQTLAPHDTKVFIGDQADPVFLDKVIFEVGQFDVIIDDGGHTANQQITSFETLYKHMTQNGVYIVEDTHTAFWGGGFNDRHDGRSFLDFAFDRCKDLHAWTAKQQSFERLGTPPLQRSSPSPDVPAFCRETGAISFFDSMVVFERREREEPWHEVR